MAAREEYIFAFSPTETIVSTSWKAKKQGSLVRRVVGDRHTVYQDPIFRKLGIEAYAVFDECQQAAKRTVRMSTQDTKFRSILERSQQSAAEAESNTADTEVVVSSAVYAEDFLRWTLFEVLFFSPADAPLALNMIEWANSAFFEARRLVHELNEAVARGERPGQVDFYWKTVLALILACDFESTRLALESNADLRRSVSAMKLMEALQQLHSNWLHSKTTVHKFVRWQADLKAAQAAGDFVADSNIDLISKILCGDKQIFGRISRSHAVTSWWELLPAYVNFVTPEAEIDQLPAIANECQQLAGRAEEEEPDVYLAICQLDIVAAIEAISSSHAASWWIGVHLAELVHVSDPTIIADGEVHLRTRLILDYTEDIFVHTNDYRLCAGYLQVLGELGRERLAQLMLSLPIDGEDDAMKALRLCTDFNLGDAAESICHQIAWRLAREGAWSSSLSWAARGQQAVLDRLIISLLNKSKPEDIAQMSVVEELRPLAITSPTVAFLSGYHRFMKNLEAGLTRAVGEDLVLLLQSPDAPPSFRPVLVDHLIVLLNERDAVKFPSDVLFKLSNWAMRYAEDVERKGSEKEEISKLHSLRSLLVRRLADAVVRN